MCREHEYTVPTENIEEGNSEAVLPYLGEGAHDVYRQNMPEVNPVDLAWWQGFVPVVESDLVPRTILDHHFSQAPVPRGSITFLKLGQQLLNSQMSRDGMMQDFKA